MATRRIRQDEDIKAMTEHRLGILKTIGFEILTSKQIKKSSVFDIHESVQKLKNLYDSRLGLPNSDDKCGTCNLGNTKEHQCPGHFGHLTLSTSIYNPFHVQRLVKLLNKICPGCCKRRPVRRRKTEQDSILCQMGVGDLDCEYCNESACFPKVEFKVMTHRVGVVNVDTIEMHVKTSRNTEFYPDFWKFIDRSLDLIPTPRLKRTLLPDEAIRILKAIPDDVKATIRPPMDPTSFVIKHFPIPPNCLRVMEAFACNTTSRKLDRNHKTQLLANIVSKNNTITNRCSNFYITEQDTLELQTRFAEYFESFKTFSSEKEHLNFRRKDTRSKKSMTFTRKSGPTWFKKNVLGKRTHNSALAVIAGDPKLGLRQLAIPHFVAQKLRIPVRITSHNLEKFKTFLSEKPAGVFIVRGDNRHNVSSLTDYNLLIGDIIEKPLRDGDLIFANRSPSIHMHSFIGFEIKTQTRSTFGLNPMLCDPFSADFDGDTLHLYVPQSLEAKVEVMEMFDVSQQLVCPQAGQCLMGLSEDGILSIYMMLKTNFWLDKYNMQMLNMHCNVSMPIPTILKAPKGSAPLWTGLQVISMTLPNNVNIMNSPDILVLNSEILDCSINKRWMTKDENGIIHSVYCQAGPEMTIGFLSSLQTVLDDWISFIGFSVGLKDFFLTDDLKDHKKLMAEIGVALEEAKESAKRSIDLIDSKIRVTDKVCGENCQSLKDMTYRNRVMEFDDIGIRTFHAKFREMQTTTENYTSSTNPVMAMVKAGSKGSLYKLFQQSACLGLHLLHGKRWFSSKVLNNEDFSEYPGIIMSSYLSGLNSKDFLSHTISARAMAKSVGVEGPGELFRNCMFGLREVYTAYDGSVRTRNDNHVIQFQYGGLPELEEEQNDVSNLQFMSQENEAVGTLAVTAVIEPAYNFAFEQTISTMINPVDLLKETLSRGIHSPMKDADLKSTLVMSNHSLKKTSDVARTALKVQDQLQRVTIDMLPLQILIEFNSEFCVSKHQSPWIIHIHFDVATLKMLNMKVGDILSSFGNINSEKGKAHFSSSEDCHFGNCDEASKGYSCIQARFDFLEASFPSDDADQELYDRLSVLTYYVVPSLLKITIVKGSSEIISAVIKWKDSDEISSSTQRLRGKSTNDINHRSLCGDLVVKIQTRDFSERGRSWESVKSSCLRIMDLIDWKRSGPDSIPEVCHSLGIEAARQLIYNNLLQCVQKMGKNVKRSHLGLIADYMTHTGKVLAFNAVGMKNWYKELSISAPFTEGSFGSTKRVFFEAARRRKTERLSGLLASIIWGKYDSMGDCDHFDLLWTQGKQGGFCTIPHEDISEGIISSKTGSGSERNKTSNKDIKSAEEFKEKSENTQCVVDRMLDHEESESHSTELCLEVMMTDFEMPEGSKQTLWGDGNITSIEDLNGRANVQVEVSSNGNRKKTRTCIDYQGIMVEGSNVPSVLNEPVLPLHVTENDVLPDRFSYQKDRISVDDLPHSFDDQRLMIVGTQGGNEQLSPDSGSEEESISVHGMSQNEYLPKVGEDVLSPGFGSQKDIFSVNDMIASFDGQEVFVKASLGNELVPEVLSEDALPPGFGSHNDSISVNYTTPSFDTQMIGYTIEDLPPGFHSLSDQGIIGRENKDIFLQYQKEDEPPGFESQKCESTDIDFWYSILQERTTCDRNKLQEQLQNIRRHIKNHILHSSYQPGDMLSNTDKDFMMKVLMHHPKIKEKIDGGIDAIKIGCSVKFPDSRCFVLVRKDGTSEDFSYHKCLNNLLKKYQLNK